MSASDDRSGVLAAGSWAVQQGGYAAWIREVEQPRVQALADRWAREKGCAGATEPLFSIVMPVFRPPLELLGAAIDSVTAQLWPHWELLVVDDGSDDIELAQLLNERARAEPRIRWHGRAENGGIALATNEAIAQASADWILFVDQDDLLAPQALLTLAETLAQRRDIALLYTDCDRLDADGTRIEPYFKPGWDPDLLLAQNYVNHLTVMRRLLVQELGGLREGFDGAQDHDLLLRASARLRAEEIVHLPEILYHWRKQDSSVSATRLGSAVRHARAALREHLAASGIEASVVPAPGAALFSRVCRKLDPGARIAVIVHGASAALRESSRAGLDPSRARVVDAAPAAGETAHEALGRVIGARDDDVLVLLQGGWLPGSDDWLATLAAQALRPEVGLVGPRLFARGEPAQLPPGRRWMNRWIVDTFPAAAPAEDRGYHATARLDRRVSILHGACLALRRSNWPTPGALDPRSRSASTLGADLSLRIAQPGMSALWCPAVILREADGVEAEPEPDASETAWFLHKWAGVLQCDRYFNPNLADFLPAAPRAGKT